jgi:hypothetical protein
MILLNVVSHYSIALDILNQIEAYMSTHGTITQGRELANKWSLNVVRVGYTKSRTKFANLALVTAMGT